ncbi:MAG: LamG-like jellyroll fold domain-containing protein [Verrucomicrobiota bacterium]|nr:Ig-like domain-containing protein [Limisphaera sp.]MDW8382523.1 LamG-like jellyroll fold domain-containing protein [Verrucomicrobiota bacterium]
MLTQGWVNLKPMMSDAMKTRSSAISPLLLMALAGLLTSQVPLAAQTLVHRYSFTTDASDSVGGRHGTLMNNVQILNGQALLNNSPGYDSSNPDGQYIALPAGLLAAYQNVTLETWVTPYIGDMWSRVWDFGNGTAAYLFLSTGNASTGPEAQSIAPGRAGNWLRANNILLDNSENHIVLTINGVDQIAKLYVNGVLVDVNPAFSNAPPVLGSTTNNWLGRSQWGGDDYLVGSYNEFRVYQGTMDALQVRANFATGPDAAPTRPNVSRIEFRIRDPFYLGFSRPLELLAYTDGNPEPVDIADSPHVTYTVQGPAILQINSAGVVTPLAEGTTTIIARHGSLSATQTVQVVNQPAVLRHRYSFNADARDTVGNQHGTLQGGATISGGQVLLDGVSAYVELPSYLLAPTNIPHGAVTFEGWITTYPINGAWTRLFDFGNIVGSVGSKNFFFAPNTAANGGDANLAVSDSTPGWRSEDEIFRPNILGRTNLHIVAVYNPQPNRAILALYMDGVLEGQTTTRKPLDSLNNVYSFLGRSLYGADAYLNGAISEFRIWSGELNPLQIALNGAVGPDAIAPSDPGPLQRVRLILTPNMVRGGVQQARVLADFTTVSNVNITRGIGTLYESSNTNVVTVDATGQLTAVGAGSALVTATYGGQSDSQLVTVTLKPVVLRHRWSFNETTGTTATDSVGSRHGTLMGTATFDGQGAVVLDGATGTYVELPPNIITNYEQVTFEAWVTVASTTPNNTAARLFVFGGTHDVNEVGLTPRTGGNNTFLRAFGLPNAQVLRGGTIASDRKVHVVGIFNAAGGRADLYIDGAWENGVSATYSLSALSNGVSRLGANIPGNQFVVCSIDEFRIYDGVLSPHQIAINRAAGPNAVVLNPGTPTSITLDVDSIMMPGLRRLAHVVATYPQTGPIRLRSSIEEILLTSSNPSVVRVAPGGWLVAVAPGSATITAHLGGRSDTKTVTVVEKQVALLHRYNFATDGSDVIGAQDGFLAGAATIVDGKVSLVNDGTYKANAYVELPPGLVSSLDAVTIEAWVDLGPQGSWVRVFDIGDHTSGGAQNGISYIFLSRPWAATPTRLVFSDGVTAASEVVLDAGTFSLEGFNGQIVAVLDGPNNQMALYANGALLTSGPMNNKQLANLRDVKCWIGRSLYAADAGLSGTIDEFRIYAGALSAADIAANYAAGPNTVRPSLLPVQRPTLRIRLQANQAVLSWPTWAEGFRLVTSPVLPAITWSPVTGTATTNQNEIQVTVPLTGTQQYYRLER